MGCWVNIPKYDEEPAADKFLFPFSILLILLNRGNSSAEQIAARNIAMR